jgi:hypothetical protein
MRDLPVWLIDGVVRQMVHGTRQRIWDRTAALVSRLSADATNCSARRVWRRRANLRWPRRWRVVLVETGGGTANPFEASSRGAKGESWNPRRRRLQARTTYGRFRCGAHLRLYEKRASGDPAGCYNGASCCVSAAPVALSSDYGITMNVSKPADVS